jgi:hypothetical protein
LHLIEGWQGNNWGEWLTNEAKIPSPNSFVGVWTNEPNHPALPFEVAINAQGEKRVIDNPGRAGLLQVSHRTQTYWW